MKIAPQLLARMKHPRARHQQLLLPTLLIIATLLLFLALEIATPNYFLFDDNADQFLAYYIYNWRAITSHGELPLLNFHQYLGQTHLGQGQTAVLFPPAYLAAALSQLIFGHLFHTIDIVAILHFIVGALAFYFLLRKLSITPSVSFVASLIWITFPYLTSVSQSWINISYTAAYLPLNFLLLEHLIAKPKFRYIFYLAIVKALFFLQGHVQQIFIMLQLEAIFLIIVAITLLRKSGIRQLGRFAAAYLASAVFALCLIAPVLLPMLETRRLSNERASPLAPQQITEWHISAADFINAQQFHFRPGAFYHHGSSHIAFANPILLALFILVPIVPIASRLLQHRLITYAALAIIAFLMSTPFYGAAAHVISPLNYFRWPHKYFPFFLFFMLLVATIICHRLTSRRRRTSLLFLLTLALSLNVLITWQYRDDTLSDIARTAGPLTLEYANQISRNAGRIVTFRYSPYTEQHDYQLLGFAYATLFDLFHFGGYDPLISKQNIATSLGLHYANNLDADLTPQLMNYLSTWNVRYLVAPSTPWHRRYLDSIATLKPLFTGQHAILYENQEARALVHDRDHPERHLPFQLGINRLTIFPHNQEPQQLSIAIAPLPQLYVYIDGQLTGKVSNPGPNPIQLTIPANTKQVVIRYTDTSFLIGSIFFALFWLAILGIALPKILTTRK